MAQRLVSLPALGRRVPLCAYLAAVRRAKAAPETEFKTSFEGWWPAKGAEVVQQFRRGIHARINRHVPGYGQGRKWRLP